MSTTTQLAESPKMTALQAKFASLKEQALALVVDTQDRYLAALELVKAARTYKKEVGFELDPGIQSASDHLNLLRDQKKRHISPAEEIERIASQKAEDFRKREKEAAEAEQRRINEERRKEAERIAEAKRKELEAEAEAARKKMEKELAEQRKAGDLSKREAERLKKVAEAEEARLKQLAAQEAEAMKNSVQDVKVEAAIPKVAGIRGRTNWRFKIVNLELIPDIWWVPDETAIGAMVRSMKDKAKAEAACPGIEVYSEESV